MNTKGPSVDMVNLDGSVRRELLESIAQEGCVIYEKV